MFRRHPRLAGRSNRTAPPTITVIAGGSFLSLTEYEQLLSQGPVLVLDAPVELAQRFAKKKLNGIHAFSLAAGQTALTLAANAKPEIRDALRNLPGINLAQGLGQYRGIGSLGAQRLLKDPQFQLYLLDEVPAMLLAEYGTLTNVSIVGKAGLAGGTGSDAVQLIVDAISQILLRKTDAAVSVHFDFIGAVTSVGLGQRTSKNAAAGTLQSFEYVCAKNHHSREIRTAVYRELPAVGPNRQARDNLVQQVEQAVMASEVREVTERRAPNQGLNGRFANATVLRTDFHEALDPRLDVAPDVARCYEAAFRNLTIVKPDRCVQELLYGEARRDLPQESIDDLTARALTTDADELYEAVKRPAFNLKYEIRAALKTSVSLNLSAAHTLYSQQPTSEQETQDRLTVQAASLDAIEEEHALLMDRHGELASEAAELDKQLCRAIDAIHPTSFFGRLFAAARSLEGRLQSFGDAAEAIRGIEAELTEVQAKIAALQEADRGMRSEHTFLLDKLANIVSRLEPIALQGHAQRNVAYVNCLPLNECFGSLWEIDQQMTENEIIRLLNSATRTVTVHGLAKIVGAESPRLEVIAKRIAGRMVSVTGPSWGGKERRDTALVIHVLPPLRAEEAAVLRKLVEAEDAEALVAMADVAVAGVNVIDLHFHAVEQPSDLLTGYYAQEFVEVDSSPQRALYLPRDVKSDLGFHIVNGRLIFTQS